MIAIDANLLLYAYSAAAPQHVRARHWLEMTFSTAPLVGLPLVCVLAFLRIVTDRRLSANPHTGARASAIVAGWLARENVTLLVPRSEYWPIFFRTLRDAEVTGPRVTDVHLAALAIEHGATWYTNDRDFRIFPELNVVFPLLDDA